MDSLQGRFAQALQQEILILERMESVLQRENEVLSSRDALIIDDILKEKQEVIAEARASVAGRLKLLESEGQASDEEAVLAFVQADATDELPQLWKSLEETLKRCQKQNQINGLLLEKTTRFTRQMLDTLMGGGDEVANLYDGTGRGESRSNFTTGRSIKV